MLRLALVAVAGIALLLMLSWERRAVRSVPVLADTDAAVSIPVGARGAPDWPPAGVAVAPRPVAVQPAVTADSIARRLPSLRGATLPDGLRVDDDGNLVVDDQLKLLFDFLLAGRVDADDATLDDIMIQLTAALPDAAAEQALQRWHDYQQYQYSIRALAAEAPLNHAGPMLAEPQLEQIEGLLARRRQLQQEYLGEFASGWFGAENAYDRRMLALARQQPMTATGQAMDAALSVPTELQQRYEVERDQVLQAGLAPDDRARQLDQLRRDYFPERHASVRQALRDLADGVD